MIICTLTAIAVIVGSLFVEQVQCARMAKFKTNKASRAICASGAIAKDDPSKSNSNCFPAVGFKMPDAKPTSLTGWWCDLNVEYAFLGFSYDTSPCDFFMRSMFFYMMLTTISFSGQSLTQLKADFLNMRTKFKARYVRLYGVCDDDGF